MKRILLENLCYTELVYERINKKLATDLPKRAIEALLRETIAAEAATLEKRGKNWYVTHVAANLRITINANTYRVITVDPLN